MTIQYHYDELDRIELKDYEPLNTPTNPDPADWVYSYYDNGFGRGRLERIENGGGANSTLYGYNLFGQVANKTRDLSGLSFFFTYHYDQLGRPTSMMLPDISNLAHSYDGSVLTNITVSHNLLSTFEIDAMDYHPSGALSTISIPIPQQSPIKTDYTYYDDTDHRLKIVQTTTPVTTAQHFRYTWDVAGNLLDIEDKKSTKSLDQEFEYDPFHRLAKAEGTAGSFAYGPIYYTYDDSGNLLTKGGLHPKYERIVGGPFAMTKVCDDANCGQVLGTYGYDVEGGLTSRNADGINFSTWRNDDGRMQLAFVGINYYTYQYDDSGSRTNKRHWLPWPPTTLKENLIH